MQSGLKTSPPAKQFSAPIKSSSKPDQINIGWEALAMNRNRKIAIFATVVFLIAPVCKADSFSFSYSSTSGLGNTVSASGSITATNEGLGAFLITGLTGTFTDGSLTAQLGLDPAPMNAPNSGDQRVYYGHGVTDALDPLGLVLDDISDNTYGAGKGYFIDIYSSGSDVFAFTDGSGSLIDGSSSGSFVLSNAMVSPEPSNWTMLAAGMLLLGGMILGKRRRNCIPIL
jgi:hypothetical protein